MKYRVLALLPLVAAAIFLVFTGETFDTWEVLAVKTLSFVGCVFAAFTLGWREYLGRAWLLNGLCMLLLVGYDLLRMPVVEFALRERMIDVFGLTANVMSVVGTYMLGRAWRVAGVEPDLSEDAQRAILVGGILVAIGVGAPGAYLDFRNVLEGGHADALVSLASDVGDVLALCFVAPVLLTALALRGGLLGWPWGLMTTSLFSWVVYDALDAISQFSASDTLRTATEVARTLACIFTFSGGMAQAMVVRAARRR
jgi:hypothetical protein